MTPSPIEHRRAEQADHHQRAAQRRPVLHRHRGQGQHRDQAAFAVVVGAQDQQHVLQRDDDRHRPEDQRQHAEDVVVRGRHVAAVEHFLQRVQRAGADVAVDDAQRADDDDRERLADERALGEARGQRHQRHDGRDRRHQDRTHARRARPRAAASRRAMPARCFCCTRSTSTMALVTTMPMSISAPIIAGMSSGSPAIEQADQTADDRERQRHHDGERRDGLAERDDHDQVDRADRDDHRDAQLRERLVHLLGGAAGLGADARGQLERGDLGLDRLDDRAGVALGDAAADRRRTRSPSRVSTATGDSVSSTVAILESLIVLPSGVVSLSLRISSALLDRVERERRR